MIDPLHSLAFAVQANPGVYALLLGSGVSRSAKIPTGWEITLDLVSKVAHLHGEDCGSKPEEWYLAKYGMEPDYSKLLNEIARTTTERQQLLQGYFEATDAEHDEGAKQPTEAHKAIASMVSGGFIRVILTTNFDRLLERALEEVGVTPTVISSIDHLKGALPLIHTRCCVLKIHGDYLDTRIRNTPEELSDYPDEWNAYLDRVFDEFGLIACGWSADWDTALRNAVIRTPSRRFSMYWAARGEPREPAKGLIDHRGAQVITIKDADSFFQTLNEQVRSLEAFARPHPLSTEAAVASLKKYLTESRFKIQLADLVGDEVERVANLVTGPRFRLEGGPPPDSPSFTERVQAYESASITLVAIASVGGYWAEEQHHQVWQAALARLATVPVSGGFTVWTDLRRYPATLLLYALGLSAVYAGRLKLLSELLTIGITVQNHEEQPAVQLLPPLCLFSTAGNPAKLLEGMDRRHAPMSDHLHDTLRPVMKRMIADDHRFELAFDKLEILMALAFIAHAKRTNEWDWAPIGSFGYRHQNRTQILKEMEESIDQYWDGSPYIASGIFGSTHQDCQTAIEKLKTVHGRLNWW